MSEIKRQLLDQLKKYPKADLEDLFKYLCQSVFGPGHLFDDILTLKEGIQKEYSDQTDHLEDIDYIGDDLVRLPLSFIAKGLEPMTLAKLLCLSAKDDGTILKLEAYLKELQELIVLGSVPFSMEDYLKEVTRWKENGYAPPHHSARFKEAYHPSYRLIKKDYLRYIPLFIKIDGAHQDLIVAIDGPSGSGKSTLGALLYEIYDCTLIHLDDFFLRAHQRTKKRLKEPGGNIDYERFEKEVLIPLQKGEDLNYRPFDCQTMELADPVHLSKRSLVIIEGSYALHPRFQKYYDYKVFLDIEKSQQTMRIQKRNGALAKRFLNEWIPLEDKYHDAFKIREHCDLII